MELKNVGRDGMLPEWAILTGGGAKMRWLADRAREYLRLPASIGVPEQVEWVSGTSIADPIYTSVIGTLLLAQKYGTAKKPFKFTFSPGKSMSSLKALFKKFMP
jgi:cell division ATPase FtsA